jgi:hypothetical protein
MTKRHCCVEEGCVRKPHSNGRRCAAHQKRLERGTDPAARIHLKRRSLRERVLALVMDLADAQIEYERRWDSLEHALRDWARSRTYGGTSLGALLTAERRSELARMGGLALAAQLTPEERRTRAAAGGHAAAARMTPAQRTARARKAALARHGARRGNG